MPKELKTNLVYPCNDRSQIKCSLKEAKEAVRSRRSGSMERSFILVWKACEYGKALWKGDLSYNPE